MLRVLLWLGQFLVVAPSVYETLISLFGLRTPAVRQTPNPSRSVRVVVPAHDEATVIEAISRDLAGQDYPAGLLEACVIADRCVDDTADRASRWVPTAVRTEGDGGKGAAISWYLDRNPLEAGEALLVLDADNRIEPSFVRSIASALEHDECVQAYLDVANPDASILTMAGALTYWASNRSVQLARSNLGWSCDLGGTGMAITGEALAAAGGLTDDLTEDLSLNIRLNLAGHRVAWLHHVHVRDEKPARTGDAVTQRARWVRGKREVQRAHGRVLLAEAIRRRSFALADLLFRLYNPGRSALALLLVVLTIVAWLAPDLGLWPLPLLTALTAIVVLLPVVFLLIDRIPARYVVRYPFVAVVAILWLPIRVASRFVGGWRRTRHTG